MSTEDPHPSLAHWAAAQQASALVASQAQATRNEQIAATQLGYAGSPSMPWQQSQLNALAVERAPGVLQALIGQQSDNLGELCGLTGRLCDLADALMGRPPTEPGSAGIGAPSGPGQLGAAADVIRDTTAAIGLLRAVVCRLENLA